MELRSLHWRRCIGNLFLNSFKRVVLVMRKDLKMVFRSKLQFIVLFIGVLLPSSLIPFLIGKSRASYAFFYLFQPYAMFLPLILCSQFFSREKSSRTIEYLLTLPLSPAIIIVGKSLSILLLTYLYVSLGSMVAYISCIISGINLNLSWEMLFSLFLAYPLLSFSLIVNIGLLQLISRNILVLYIPAIISLIAINFIVFMARIMGSVSYLTSLMKMQFPLLFVSLILFLCFILAIKLVDYERFVI